MNDIVIEIKLVVQVMGLLQVHGGHDKGHIYGLDTVRMVRTEIKASQEMMDHLHLYYIYLLALKL